MRHVHIEKNRYGSRQPMGAGMEISTTEIIDTKLGPEEIVKLERSKPFVTVLDHANVDSSRRRMAIYNQYDVQMSTERKKLQYALDILPKNAKLHPSQPKAPLNYYFKKGQRRSVPVIHYPLIINKAQINQPIVQ